MDKKYPIVKLYDVLAGKDKHIILNLYAKNSNAKVKLFNELQQAIKFFKFQLEDRKALPTHSLEIIQESALKFDACKMQGSAQDVDEARPAQIEIEKSANDAPTTTSGILSADISPGNCTTALVMESTNSCFITNLTCINIDLTAGSSPEQHVNGKFDNYIL